jgi:hypothetical protein
MTPEHTAWIPPGLQSWLGFLAFFAVWIILQVWLLPKLGVPT